MLAVGWVEPDLVVVVVGYGLQIVDLRPGGAAVAGTEHPAEAALRGIRDTAVHLDHDEHELRVLRGNRDADAADAAPRQPVPFRRVGEIGRASCRERV